ncbi:DUF488 domain-containing protein [Gracilibacillus dipsosauri]|uniref:DUF488 domain-containing protein n=1 Tax=Gracilibacillus dipsosauri TaxID=178340 RepID=A0A317KVH7_9BACI|nr:DUF488 family protein [Gracilibacillus dipsosauri]PWU67522.1 DUF488 domain-containing protein [Gracilibacillus dipsosauri]
MQLKRVYEEAEKKDNFRVLVDRIWPRGVSKQEAKLDLWLKEIGPSKELRKWFGHDPDKFDEFRQKYLKELEEDTEKKEAFDHLIQCYEEQNGEITLVFATKELKYNHVVIIKEKLINERK